jgi:hypothetical protein
VKRKKDKERLTHRVNEERTHIKCEGVGFQTISRKPYEAIERRKALRGAFLEK